MPAEPSEYKKSFEDELDWNLIDQLHKVVLQISGFCFRTKQICLTVNIAVIGLLIKFTENKLDKSVFVAGLVVPLAFWFLDSIAYYYQVKVRGTMKEMRENLRNRNVQALIQPQENCLQAESVISSKRIHKSNLKNITSAAFNHSMWLYALLIAADTVCWLLFNSEYIQ